MGEVIQIFDEAVADLTAPGAAFALEEVDGPHGRVRIFKDTEKSLYDFLAKAELQFSERPFLEYEGARRTYSDIFSDAALLGGALRALHDVRKGDRVGIAMRNLPEWFVSFIALQRLGAVATLLNSRGAPDELFAAAERVGCKLILADDRCAERLDGISTIPVVDLAGIAALIAEGGADDTPAESMPDDPAAILFTSGTTGRPKGATLNHRNLCIGVRITQYLSSVGLKVGARRAGVDPEKLRSMMPTPSLMGIFPMFHISGIMNLIVASLGGGMITLLRRWDAETALNLIEKNKVTAITGPSLVMVDLLDLPNASERMASVTAVTVGGQASPLALNRRIKKSLPRSSQGNGWGMTELAGSVSNATGPINEVYPGTIGRPLPVFDLEVRGPDGSRLPQGEVGEIVVRGPGVMIGYWNDAEATASCIRDGWLHTGDLGYFDEKGLLFLVDRAKDMVISAGENIYCAEVERVLGSFVDHTEVALFGVPDDRLGERAVAAVVLRPGIDVPDQESVRALAREHLADYKVPAEVIFDLGPLPRNALGKIDKKALRNRYLEKYVPA